MTESGRIELKKSRRKAPLLWRIFLMVFLVIGLTVLSILAAKWSGTLRVQKVVVEGTKIIPARQIFVLAGVPLKSLMDTVDFYEVRSRILRQPFVRRVDVDIRYPDAIYIEVEEREPIASVNMGQLRYVDAEAVLLPQIESEFKLDLPIISGIDGLQRAAVGEKIGNEDLEQAISFLRTARQVDSTMYRSVSEINMSGGKDIIMYYTDVGIPVIVGRGEFGKKLLMLQTFWNDFVRSGNAESLQYVDLRYNDQAVVKWRADSRQVRTVL